MTSLRLAEPEDEPFLFRLFAEARRTTFAPLSLDPAALDQLLRLQHRAQQSHYAIAHPRAESRILLRGGEAVGRLLLDRLGEVIWVVDIALLPDHQGKGLGSEVLRGVLDEADASGRPVRLHVDPDSPALRLYERLGFVPIAEEALKLLLERPPGER